MTVIIDRTGTPEGEAALTAAVAEAQRRTEDLLVFNPRAPNSTRKATTSTGCRSRSALPMSATAMP
ncbi:hypothetical protein [Arthrobacter globiformis]|uniref:hypothetical protein n=1 Tax=Arthrobacter globiformis TaxID=1665 RepID=UPI002790D2FF|nr:hypothetical protein [Arthrobacter globiformis]MDQ0618489.1 hypothetical protein [Arthrobacter globiformis]